MERARKFSSMRQECKTKLEAILIIAWTRVPPLYPPLQKDTTEVFPRKILLSRISYFSVHREMLLDRIFWKELTSIYSLLRRCLLYLICALIIIIILLASLQCAKLRFVVVTTRCRTIPCIIQLLIISSNLVDLNSPVKFCIFKNKIVVFCNLQRACHFNAPRHAHEIWITFVSFSRSRGGCTKDA